MHGLSTMRYLENRHSICFVLLTEPIRSAAVRVSEAVMHTEKRAGSRSDGGDRRPRCRPRVVIFDLAEAPQVEVVELPENACPGHTICHGGRNWLITGSRTGSRVLIAEPDAN